jgi:hypothetical protein
VKAFPGSTTFCRLHFSSVTFTPKKCRHLHVRLIGLFELILISLMMKKKCCYFGRCNLDQ